LNDKIIGVEIMVRDMDFEGVSGIGSSPCAILLQKPRLREVKLPSPGSKVNKAGIIILHLKEKWTKEGHID
jgi:hypothetical protein